MMMNQPNPQQLAMMAQMQNSPQLSTTNPLLAQLLMRNAPQRYMALERGGGKPSPLDAMFALGAPPHAPPVGMPPGAGMVLPPIPPQLQAHQPQVMPPQPQRLVQGR